jgi:hypothetical protein
MAGFDNDIVFGQEGLDIGAHPNTLGYLASIEFDEPGADVNLSVFNTSNIDASNAVQQLKVTNDQSMTYTRWNSGDTRSYAIGMNRDDATQNALSLRCTKANNGNSAPNDPETGNGVIIWDISENGGRNTVLFREGRVVLSNNNSLSRPVILLLNNGNVANQNTFISLQVTNGGSPFIQYTGTGVGGWAHGATSNATKLFRLGLGANPAALSVIAQQVTPAGEVTFPSTPSFLAQTDAGSAQNNVTGAGTVYTILYPTEIYDVNSDYSSPTFTAPVTGKYYFWGCVQATALDAAATSGGFGIATSNRTYGFESLNWGAVRTASNRYEANASVVADMDAGDTCHLQFNVNGMAGDTVGIQVGSTNNNRFGGFLVG